MLKAGILINTTGQPSFKQYAILLKRKDIIKMTDKEKLLADHLAAMCCQADEDCPAEYRTEHFRSTMDDAYEYLEKIGYFKK